MFLPGGLAGNRVLPRDGSCAAMSEYKGWHVFMQRLYLPFSKKLRLMDVLSTEDAGWVLSSLECKVMIKLRRLQAAKENLSDRAVLVVSPS